jgi:Zn-dependent protease with chaperone function
MSFLLMVFLASVCLFTAYPAPSWGSTPWLSALLTFCAIAFVAGCAAVIARRVRRPLDEDPTQLDSLVGQYESMRRWHTIILLATYVIALGVLGWGDFVRSLYVTGVEILLCAAKGGADVGQQYALGNKFGVGAEFLLLLPFILSQVASWFFFYDADRAAHIASHRLLDLASFAPSPDGPAPVVPPFGSRWSYVVFQLRQKLALAFVPVLLLIARQELFRLLPESLNKGIPELILLTVFGLFGVLFALPFLIRMLLGLRPMEAGPLRERLEATAQRMGIGISDILIWNTRSGMANALIIGLVPWARYVVFTDRMLEEFTPEEIQAVFGHELGHVAHGHMLYYLTFLSTSLLAIGLAADNYLLPVLKSFGIYLADTWPHVFPAQLGEYMGGSSDLAMFPMLLVILAYIFIVFGYVSRRCERQADIFGCRAVSCSDTGCTAHDDATQFSAAAGLCPAGIQTFIDALEKVATVNGIDRERPGFLQSWQHGSIAQRVEFLRSLLNGEQDEPAFQWRFSAFKWGMAVSLCVALVIMGAVQLLKTGDEDASRSAEVAHRTD